MERYILAAFAVAASFNIASAIGPKTMAEVIAGAGHLSANQNENVWIQNRASRIEPHHFVQRVDNFDSHNDATYEQRYFFLDDHFVAGGPLYVILGSQSPASNYDLPIKLITSVAREENGSVYVLESRYYGQSIPTANLSVDNLRFLTVEQTLADAAHFIGHIKATTPGAHDSPVVVVGQHYGGSLALWFRQKYPHLAVGAWGSSSPVLAIQNNQQYKVNAGATILELAGMECYSVIEDGFREMEALANAGNLRELGEAVNVCEQHGLESHNDVALLFLIISEFFTSITTLRPYVAPVCDMLLQHNDTSTPAEAVAIVFKSYLGGSCIPVDYEEFIRRDRVIEIDSDYSYMGLRAITYQLCTQLGWFATSESASQPFGSFYPLAFYTEVCTNVFGDAVASHEIAQANQDRFNVQHGGLNPSITNALFTYGEDDPNRSIGIMSDLNESAVVISIADAGISYDFDEISYYDDEKKIDAKLRIMATIRSWTN